MRTFFIVIGVGLLSACSGGGEGQPALQDGGARPADAGSSCRADGWCREDVGVAPLHTFGSSLLSVHGTSAADVWTVGQDGVILHFDGAHWSRATSPTSTALTGVFAADPKSAWAVGDGGTIAQWDGAVWTAPASGTSQNLHGVWASSASDAWAVGDGGTILHFDGARWTSATSGTPNDLSAVAGTSANDVWAVGSEVTLHFDGGAWKVVESFGSPNPSDEGAVFALAPNDAWLLLTNGVPVHWDGASWTRPETEPKTTSSMHAIGGTASNDVWLVGWGPSDNIFHFDGATWSSLPEDPVKTGGSFNSVFAPKGSKEVFVVGSPDLDSNFVIWRRR